MLALATLLLFSVTVPNPAYCQSPPPTDSYYIYVDPTSTADTTLTPGKNYTISIKMNYTGDDVWGYEFTLTYNPLVLNGTNITNGDLITKEKHESATFQAGTFNNTAGKLSLTSAFFFIEEPAPLTYGPGTLASVTFTVVGTRDSDITLEPKTTKLIGYSEGGYGEKYDIIDDTEPEFGHVLPGYFRNTEAPSIHDVAVIGVTASPTTVEAGDLVEIAAIVENQGTVAEIFEVNVYYNEHFHIVPTKTVRGLEVGENKSLAWTWSTTDLSEGNYTIEAVASTLPRETDTADNTYTDGTVRVAIREDFTTYTEVDPNSHISVTANHIDHDAYRNEDAYIYKDRGAGHFTNFTHLVDVRSDFLQNKGVGVVWMLSNEVDDWSGLLNGGKTAVRVGFYRASGRRWLQLSEAYGGTKYYAQHGASANTWYYLKIQKSGTNLTCKIYSDLDRTNLLDALSLTLHADHSFRYVFAGNTANTGKNKHLNNDVENLYLLEQALEDFNRYEEVDPNDHIYKTGLRVSFLGLMRNETAYVYKDMGIGYFRDFDHLIDFKITEINASSPSDRVAVALWMLTNTIGALNDVPHHLSVRVRQKGTNTTHYNLELAEEGGNSSLSVDLDVGTRYYLTITRTNRSVTCTIYDTPLRTVEVDSLSTTGANTTYQYIQVCTSPHHPDDPNDTVDGYIMNLNLDARVMMQTKMQASSESTLFTLHLAIPDITIAWYPSATRGGKLTFKDAIKPGERYWLHYDTAVYAIRDELAKIDINVEVYIVDKYTWMDIIGSEDYSKTYEEGGWQHGWDMALVGWDAMPTDLVGYEKMYAGGSQPPYGANYFDWQNEKADTLLERGMSKRDPTIRKQYIWLWQEMFMHDPPLIPLYYLKGWDVTVNDLEGWDTVVGWHDGWNLNVQGKTPEDDVTIKWGSHDELYDLNPLFAWSGADFTYAAQTFETLMKPEYDPGTEGYKVVPWLANDYPTYSADGKIVTVYLRNNVLWHDHPDFANRYYLNNNDVKLTFEALMNFGYGEYADIIDWVEANTGDQSKVIFHLKKTYPAFDSLLSQTYILPRHFLARLYSKYGYSWTGWRSDPTNTNPNKRMPGTGPFKLVHKDTTHWEMEANEEYWKWTTEPMVDHIFGVYIPSTFTGFISLMTHEIDFGDCWTTNGYTMQAIIDGKGTWYGLKALPDRSPTLDYLAFNLNHEKLSNRYVRQAIAHAISYPYIFNTLMPAYPYEALPGKAPVFPIQQYTDPNTGETVHFFNNDLEPYEYNLIKAQQYLDMWYYSQVGTDYTLGPIGDADFSGQVNLDDWWIWRENFGTTPAEWTFPPGNDIDPDFDNNGFVDVFDEGLWSAKYGTEYPFKGAR